MLTLVLALPGLETQAAPPPGYTLAWQDTFDGSTLKQTNWTIGLRDPGTGDLVPGAAGNYLLNSEYAGYITAADVVVSGGSLNLLNQKRNYTGTSPSGSFSYTSGWVMSMHKVHFNKGYIEWRARFPSGAKTWPALWLIAEDLVWGPEWDCFEYFGYRSDVGYDNMGLHLLYNTYPNQQWNTAWIPNFDANFDCEAWHVYGFEWTADYARWTIDGVEYRFLANTIGSLWPNEQMYIVMNNGVRSSSPLGSTVWPNNFEIDYVQLYQINETLPIVVTNPPPTATRLQHGQINLVAAASGSTPLSWQWKLNGNNIPGATNASLLLKDLALSQAGVYQAFVTNQFGGTNSTTCTLSLTRNLVRNGHFGTAQDAANFGSTSTNNWIMAAPGNWNLPTVALDTNNAMGTCGRIGGNWNSIMQDTTETYQPNTRYTVTLQARGDAALTVILMDANDAAPSNWVQLAQQYLWIGGNAVYSPKTYDFSTNDFSAHVGKKIGIKLRREVSWNTGPMSFSQVRLNAFGPPVLGNAQKPGATQASFTINSWDGQTNGVWTSPDLVNWSFLTSVTNVSGADTFIDSAATAPRKFYQLR